ncbi:MAG: dNTP triphosphohydrolase [Acidobacteriota bacterium]|nr:dNTP triphosphohydrolase [Acidobacteriota bacterium]
MARIARDDRFHGGDRGGDQRSAAQRDRDRLLYCSAFRRLAGVTQVVSSAEGHVFHNRLTHTLKVAQIARRLGETLAAAQPAEARALGGVDPDVTEAAALAHDLGHPPFGHLAERELDRLAREAGVPDGFEGNAQSFRIVTRLTVRHPDLPGLNLTRATLNALLKYPWTRQARGGRHRKFGAYLSERAELRWARQLATPRGDERPSVEAALMDWADDIAYSVHDVEDFYRAGLVPLDRLVADRRESGRFLERAFAHWRQADGFEGLPEAGYQRVFDGLRQLVAIFQIDEPFRGTGLQRAGLRSLTSNLVSRYVEGIRLHVPATPAEPRVTIEPHHRQELKLLKELVWQYVILNPGLATQHHGQTEVIRTLFEVYLTAARTADRTILPPRAREELDAADRTLRGRAHRTAQVRTVLDLVAGMTDAQALRLFRRFTGSGLGSFTDPLQA